MKTQILKSKVKATNFWMSLTREPQGPQKQNIMDLFYRTLDSLSLTFSGLMSNGSSWSRKQGGPCIASLIAGDFSVSGAIIGQREC